MVEGFLLSLRQLTKAVGMRQPKFDGQTECQPKSLKRFKSVNMYGKKIKGKLKKCDKSGTINWVGSRRALQTDKVHIQDCLIVYIGSYFFLDREISTLLPLMIIF